MPDLLTLLQLGLSAVLLGAIGERVYTLMFAAPLHRRGLEFVTLALERAQLAELTRFATSEGARDTHVGRVLRVALRPAQVGESRGDQLAELSFDLSAEAIVRLRALRVGATIASTLGLLVGIVRLRGGFAQPSGLLALEAGLTERLAVADALFSMAIGVGTSAVCFYALSLLREAARSLIAQRARIENLLQARFPSGPGQPLDRPSAHLATTPGGSA
jgi:hypothetical protein